ncbi:hypothetical protein QYE76_027521 [Lolium multiflorum]|uniref:No apical meristem-associated C-terminal domain-containing protein n=1 Tax=Lolium multiflorum TaxID=4521 RepID=A0AAD8QJ87_LOLMU|nr:hypothetical protein QYE76_027521 [Lolium multiflorum]
MDVLAAAATAMDADETLAAAPAAPHSPVATTVATMEGPPEAKRAGTGGGRETKAKAAKKVLSPEEKAIEAAKRRCRRRNQKMKISAAANQQAQERQQVDDKLCGLPRSCHKATKADLQREAQALAFTQSMEKMMADNHAAMAARDEKRRLEKEAAAAIYHNLAKEVIEVQKADAEAKLLDDAKAKILAEDTRIMLADLSSVDDDTRAWFMKRRAEIRARDA